MSDITGFDIADIEDLCKEMREGRISDEDFRKGVIEALGYDPVTVMSQIQIRELEELW
jgi:hypothetical protein